MIFKKIMFAVIVCFVFSCADPIEQASQKAYEAYASGDIDGAIALNKKVLDLDSTGISSCLLYTSPSPRDRTRSRMPSSA